METNYDVLASVLNQLISHHSHGKIRIAIQYYLDNPKAEIKEHVIDITRVLAELGRERPQYLARLLQLVDDIRMGRGDPELYTPEQWNEIEAAFDLLFKRERPNRLIEGIISAASNDLPYRAAMVKTELKVFAPLVMLYRGSPAKFQEMLMSRMYVYRSVAKDAQNERRAEVRARRSAMTKLVKFKNKWIQTVKQLANETDKKLEEAAAMRKRYVESRPKGVTMVKASNEFWTEYDKQLNEAVEWVERGLRSGAVIPKNVKYPNVVRA